MITGRSNLRHLGEYTQHRVGVADIENQKHIRIREDFRPSRPSRAPLGRSYAGLTTPLKIVRIPWSVRTCRNPRESRPSVTPSKPPSSTTTRCPRAEDDRSSKRCRIEAVASAFSSKLRYSRSSDLNKAMHTSTRDHSVPVAKRREVAIACKS